ncbi:TRANSCRIPTION INITIATION FACTOR TFIID 28kDa SUBUNIT [Encephalitozoon cuniculi GB-M1]|uniref:Transcription initiation factor TFIID subunit 11 n=2 Tax=Encephalitozoon cuniculi TaxID=6035 RepID=Q8SSE1_ENCCU|nr:transcription initiation factor TFIID [Encephalitozoon cuniculi GB-M1]AGE95622.1 transcription initiation factor TFIId28kDa subunit [Encephalitozoon cuniculi]KMV66643.1 transcription initiation factor TFIID [Encephalitozoon cuniculi EcunIII-L]UYI28318.1 transcription initiation factor TFIID subunit [Encephalitozoon cuniculi]CAD25154.1 TRANSCRIPTION INITIATION FACTOR TFIID 28kDa SUBUNIT [Encephalitozoon cuniculi GB-M1]
MNESNDEVEKEQNVKDLQSDTESDDLNLMTDDSTYKREDPGRLHSITGTMSEEELHRYEKFRGSGFPKAAIKKYISSVIGQAVNPNFVIAVCGLAKVFVGEMIEIAKAVQEERREEGPLLPSHIHEAYRRLYKRIPNTKVFKKAPWNS